MNSVEQIWCFLSEMLFEIFTSMGSHDNKNEKQFGKNPKFDISKFYEQLW